MKNKELKDFYEKVYIKGERAHYTKLLLSSTPVSQEKEAILNEFSWKGKKVLDIGCGTGELAYHIASRGAKNVVAIDYSPAAIKIAEESYVQPNLEYRCQDVDTLKGKFDVVTVVGVLEHIDNPFDFLKRMKNFLEKNGSLIITCPNWSNPRGYILLALKDLFGAKITLADIHFFTPVEFEIWAKKLKMKLSWKTIEQEWGHGYKMIEDLKKRLPNVLKDIPGASKNGVSGLVDWLEEHVPVLEADAKHTGAVGFYHLKK